MLISNPLELRLDNLVLDRYSQLNRFSISDFNNFRQPNMGGNYGFSAIPLTEDWLLKFRFETDHVTFDKGDFRIGQFVGENNFIWLPTGSLNSSHHGVKLVYVHQLQNLYFAIICQELTINTGE